MVLAGALVAVLARLDEGGPARVAPEGAADSDRPVARSRLPAGQPDRARLARFTEVRVEVSPPSGSPVVGCLLLAASAEERSQGLMGVTDLGGYHGMVFVYDTDTDGAFYMRATPMPLSIAWFDAGGVEVDRADMAPCADRADCRLYRPRRPYRVAVEVPDGELDGLAIVPGARLTVGGSCSA